MLKSGNDAAETLAEAAGGSVYGFSGLMNAKAWQIGARNSHFMNPHGLPNDDHYATAYDLALIFRQAMNHPMFADIVRTRSATLRIESGSGLYGDWRMVPVQNHNRLLASYEGTRGGKTGFTLKARRCFVGEVDRGGVRLIVSILGSPSSSTLWSDARTLLDYGFARYGLAPPPPVQPEPQLILVRRAPAAAPGEEEDETMVRSAPVLASSATTIRPAVRAAATPPARDWQQEAEADELMLPTKPVVAARTRGIVTTPAAARPAVAAAKPAAARPTLAAAKPAVAGKPAVATAKPAVARPTLAAAKPVVAAAKPTVMTRPVAAAKPGVATAKPGVATAKPGVATAKPGVAVRPTVTAAAKPVVVKPNRPLVLAMTTVKPIGAPEKTSKLTASASGKTTAKPASVTPPKLEKREPVKTAVRTESVAKLQKSRR
jgi:D-alanyl-D-alanine carboxypeptidase